jgi:hypothetical protein
LGKARGSLKLVMIKGVPPWRRRKGGLIEYISFT